MIYVKCLKKKKKALSGVKNINQPQHLNLAQHIVIHLAYFSPHDTPFFSLSRGRTKTHYAACRFWPVNNCPDRVYSVRGGSRLRRRGLTQLLQRNNRCLSCLRESSGGGVWGWKGARMWDAGALGTNGSDNKRPQSWLDMEKRGTVIEWG